MITKYYYRSFYIDKYNKIEYPSVQQVSSLQEPPLYSRPKVPHVSSTQMRQLKNDSSAKNPKQEKPISAFVLNCRIIAEQALLF